MVDKSSVSGTLILRIVGIVLNLAILIVVAIAGSYSGDWAFLLAVAIIVMIVSFVLLILYLVGVLNTTGLMKTLDALYNIISGAVILVAAIICLVILIRYWVGTYSKCAKDANGNNLCDFFLAGLIAAVLGIISGVVHILIGVAMWKSK